MKVTIIGGGFSGLSLAYYFPEGDYDITIIEKEDNVGGLASTFPYGEHRLDRFYHTILSGDNELLRMIEDNGLLPKIVWQDTTMGFWINGKVYPLNTALDLIRFSPLAFKDRIKAGISSLILSKENDIDKLEAVTAVELLIRYFGERTFSYIWKPLLISKFGEKYAEVPATWVRGRLKRQTETKEKKAGPDKTAYLEDGLDSLIKSVENNLKNRNVKIIKGNGVKDISGKNDNTLILTLDDGTVIETDKAVATIPCETLTEILSVKVKNQSRIEAINYQGVICLLLLTDRQLTDYYWIPVVKENLPFAGVVETTNLIKNLQGKNINMLYLMDYTSREKTFNLGREEIFVNWTAQLEKVFPEFNKSNVKDYFVFRNRYIEPVARLHYSRIKPPNELLDNRLYLLNTSQLYPEINCLNNCIKQSKVFIQRYIKKNTK